MLLRGTTWHYDFIVDGVRYRGSTGLSDKAAAEAATEALKVRLREKHSVSLIWEQTKRKLVTAENAGVVISEDMLYKAYMKTATGKLSKRRDDNLRSIIRCFVSFVGANVRVSAYTAADAQRYIDHVKSLDFSFYTKNIRVSTIRRCFQNLGRDYGVMENPFAAFVRQRGGEETREAFTPDELRLIGDNAKGWLYSLCLTALSTGLREGDICNLRQSSVDLAAGWISVKTSKTGATVDIPILPGLRAHLMDRMSVKGEYVFPELHNMYIKRQNSIGRSVKQFLADIGITGTKRHVDGYARDVSVKDVHSFRHTFVYLAATHGVPFPIVQGIVGHTSPAMTRHYMDHASRQAKAQYLAQLPDYLTGSDAPAIDDRQRLIDAVQTMPMEKVRQLLALV